MPTPTHSRPISMRPGVIVLGRRFMIRGRPLIGPHDLWPAATCIAHGLTIVIANIREFEQVPGLQVEPWSTLG